MSLKFHYSIKAYGKDELKSDMTELLTTGKLS